MPGRHTENVRRFEEGERIYRAEYFSADAFGHRTFQCVDALRTVDSLRAKERIDGLMAGTRWDSLQ